jgi:hypothetical protein
VGQQPIHAGRASINTRAMGVLGVAGGVLLIGAMLAPLPRLAEHLLLGGIVVLAAWYLGLAGVLCARNGWPTSPAA